MDGFFFEGGFMSSLLWLGLGSVALGEYTLIPSLPQIKGLKISRTLTAKRKRLLCFLPGPKLLVSSSFLSL